MSTETISIANLTTGTPSTDDILVFVDRADGITKRADISELPSASGDVSGPASSTDNAIARFDSTSGKLLQNSGATIDDSGNITATNLSGTNTGNQTSIVGITGTFAQFNTAVTDADLARTDAGNTFTGTQTITQIDLGNTDTSITRAGAGIISIEGEVINGFTTTATAAATTTLTIASTVTQSFTGTSTQTVRLPTTSVLIGQTYVICNLSTGLVTIQSSGANTITTLGQNQRAIFRALVATPTTAANWVYTETNMNANSIGKRVVVTTQSATPAINTNNGDIFQITGLAQAITSMSSSLTGNPLAGDMIMIQITDNGTARAITWGASFASTTTVLPTTTVISTMLRVLLQRNNANTVWDCVSVT